MPRFRNAIARATLLSLLLTAGSSWAGPDEVAAAQSLFDQAKSLMAEEKYAQACPKLEESQRLDPGVGTVFQLAACYEKLGRTASAWARFLEAAALAKASGQMDRADFAEQRAKELEPKLVRLTIDVPETTRVDGLRIERDGKEVGAAGWGTAVPVDPGSLRIKASAPGHRSWEVTLQVGAKPTSSVTVPQLEPAPAEAAPAPAPPPPAAPLSPSPPSKDPGTDRGGSSKLAWIALGVGGAGVVVGALGGAIALDKKATLDDGCPDDQCPPELHGEHDAFNRWRTISTVGFVVGAAGVGTGLVLLLTSGSESKSARRVEARVGLGSLVVGGKF